MSGGSVPGKIFIGGMPYSMDENGLKDHFEKFGTVTDCKLFVFLGVGYLSCDLSFAFCSWKVFFMES